MARVRPAHLKVAISEAAGMSLREKEAEFDIIYQEQPNLLASIIVQQQMGNTLEQMDVLLNILLIIHLSLREAGVTWMLVTEYEQERQLRRLTGRVQFSENLDERLSTEALQQMIDDHPEKWLLAFAFGEMMNAGFPMLEKKVRNI